MKKLLVILLSAALLATAVACGGTEEPAESPASESSPASEAESEPAESESEAEGEAEAQTVTGTIVDATMNTVTISTEEGTELSFALTDETDTSKAEGMQVGSTLVVTYTGSIDGTDTSAAVVTALEITAAPEAASSESAAA